MDRGWRVGVAVAFALGSVALGACDDDAGDDEEVAVTQAAYDDEAASLCERFGAGVGDPVAQLEAATNDADRVSFLRAEYVPAVRSIVRSLGTFGFPAEQAGTYGQARAVALDELDEIEEDAPELVDRLLAGTLLPEEDPFVALDEALTALDVPC